MGNPVGGLMQLLLLFATGLVWDLGQGALVSDLGKICDLFTPHPLQFPQSLEKEEEDYLSLCADHNCRVWGGGLFLLRE